MEHNIFVPLLAVCVLALYLYVDVPRGYRRWAFLFVFLLLPFLFGSPVRDLRLAFWGVKVTGTVLEARCVRGKGRYMLLTYGFVADGVRMTGQGRAGQGNGGCEMQVGDPVYVNYLPQEPTVSQAVRNPMLAALGKLLVWLAACLFLTWMKTDQAKRFKEHLNQFSFFRR
ncbi:hypothetical protein [Massilia sp. CF038]|uniref:hypothetical protein n=1 Tax=Massilia sp. CF038 TaxID=1881045 RepID=UPI0009199A0C|nr:hypothetical protein [Massilia sp. CF038]SHH52185.1 hypothetical protein SAMN05428948_4277 [Massilia sp. CF038]